MKNATSIEKSVNLELKFDEEKRKKKKERGKKKNEELER